MQIETAPARSEPSLARPVFANQDFALLRRALLHYLSSVEDDVELLKMSQLYHRLGRVG